MLLQSLAYNIELAENLTLSDYKGKRQGKGAVVVVSIFSETDKEGI